MYGDKPLLEVGIDRPRSGFPDDACLGYITELEDVGVGHSVVECCQ